RPRMANLIAVSALTRLATVRIAAIRMIVDQWENWLSDCASRSAAGSSSYCRMRSIIHQRPEFFTRLNARTVREIRARNGLAVFRLNQDDIQQCTVSTPDLQGTFGYDYGTGRFSPPRSGRNCNRSCR